jgi:hypothetical protein
MWEHPYIVGGGDQGHWAEHEQRLSALAGHHREAKCLGLACLHERDSAQHKRIDLSGILVFVGALAT